MRFSPMIGLFAFLLDLFVINGAFIGAYYREMGSLAGLNTFPFLNLIAYFNSIWILLSFVFRPYRLERMIRVTRIVGRSWMQLVVHAAVIFSLLLFQRRQILNIDHLVLTYWYAGILIFVFKIGYLYAIRMYRRLGLGYINVGILGEGSLSVELIRFFRDYPEYGFHYKGIIPSDQDSELSLQQIRQSGIQVLFINGQAIRPEQVIEWKERSEESFFRVRLIPDLRGISGSRISMVMYNDLPVIHFESFPLDNGVNRILKRGFDILFSLVILVGVLSWLTPILAVLIRAESRGPIFFQQKRTGLNNNTFYCWKFRTMIENSESDQVQASSSDQRITRLGQFLRRTSLDELPQFWNVLLGDMSVVGPRPHMVKHTEEFTNRVHKYMSRHQIKPGITGLAQVRGYRGETSKDSDLQGRVRLDRFYVENWTFLFDLKIIFDTIRVGWRQKNAV